MSSDQHDDGEEERLEAVLQYLIDEGALEFVSVSDDGEPVYRMTRRCREVFPELYDSHMADVNRVANSLWQLGVVEIEFSEASEDVTVRMSLDNYRRYLTLKGSLSEEQVQFVGAVVDERVLFGFDD